MTQIKESLSERALKFIGIMLFTLLFSFMVMATYDVIYYENVDSTDKVIWVVTVFLSIMLGFTICSWYHVVLIDKQKNEIDKRIACIKDTILQNEKDIMKLNIVLGGKKSNDISS